MPEDSVNVVEVDDVTSVVVTSVVVTSVVVTLVVVIVVDDDYCTCHAASKSWHFLWLWALLPRLCRLLVAAAAAGCCWCWLLLLLAAAAGCCSC